MNIGFSNDGKVKIFDFGLATELRSDKKNANGLYRMSGNTGTRRYMAPEIARREPYNEACDVYSFGILLWEMLANTTPFEGYNLDMFQVFVATMGERLPIDPSWPPAVQVVVSTCWEHNCKKRPSTAELLKSMEKIVNDL